MLCHFMKRGCTLNIGFVDIKSKSFNKQCDQASVRAFKRMTWMYSEEAGVIKFHEWPKISLLTNSP